MTTRRLLLIDGTNALARRAAVMPTLPPEEICLDVLPRFWAAARDLKAEFALVAFDSPASWRAALYPAYKQGRTFATQPYVEAGKLACDAAGWCWRDAHGYEADDVIATVARRWPGEVVTLSSDNDLLLLADARVRCAQYAPKGERPWLRVLGPDEVVARYGVPMAQLLDYKALVGEPGDGIPGLPGVGKVRAKRLLEQHGSLEAVLAAREDSFTVQRQVRLSWDLIRLATDAPLAPMTAKACRVPGQPATL